MQTLWISFLVFGLYLAIATSTTTHRMLFLESPIKLPVLNIDLPLLGFYILAPIIFVVFHFYVLLNLVLLARTAGTFENTLQKVFPQDGEAHEAFRMRIENTIFVQLLVGGKSEREGFNGSLLSLMALITLALAPIALILLIQIMFLPYHSEWITWLHRILLFADLVLVWTLRPGYRRGWGTRLWPIRSWQLVGYGALSVLPLFYAVAIATFPDERMYVATNWLHGKPVWSPITVKVDAEGRQMWYGWILPINTIDLRGQGLIDYAKLETITKKNASEGGTSRWEPTLSLKDRDLTEANLADADIRQVEFSDAVLNRATIDRAWADGAHFDRAQLLGTLLRESQLQEAHFNGTQLQGSSLTNALLRNASLKGAWLQGASLVGAQLEGASLDNALINEGASLKNARLQGASLGGAQLLGASLKWAQLQGAWLASAGLQGADLDAAELLGAVLDGAQLQGASLNGAQLQGADLVGAQLQGASLYRAQLQGASFERVFVWRADAREAERKDARVVGVEVAKKQLCWIEDKPSVCDWTTESFEELNKLIK